MAEALREAWIWLLLAFFVGLAVGWFLRRAPVVPASTAAAIEPNAIEPTQEATVAPAITKPQALVARAAKPAPKPATMPTFTLDDLTVIEGIGPKIAELFAADGITTWRALSKADIPRLQRILDAAGPRYRIHDPASWPKQAGLLADGKWADFANLTEKLGSRR